MLYYAKDNKQDNKEGEMPQKHVEGFTNQRVYQVLKDNFTNPTNKNPLMNVLLPEIQDNPNRKMAAPAPSLKKLATLGSVLSTNRLFTSEATTAPIDA